MPSKPVYLVDANGTVNIASDSDIRTLRSDGNLRVFHLDANLVVDLCKIGEGAVEADAARRLRDLCQLARTSQTALQWDLGLAELSYDNRSKSIEAGRMAAQDVDARKGLTAIETSLSLRKHDRILVARLGRKEVRTYLPVLGGFYAHILKIEMLAEEGLARRHAVDHLQSYLDWANRELRSISAHALQLALNVFGGDQAAARLLRLGSGVGAPQRAMNAAWDLVHAFSMHVETARKIGRRYKRTILATADKALGYVAAQCVVAAFVRESPLGNLTLAGYRITQPHFSDRQDEVRRIVAGAHQAQMLRIDRAESASPADIARAIRVLESFD